MIVILQFDRQNKAFLNPNAIAPALTYFFGRDSISIDNLPQFPFSREVNVPHPMVRESFSKVIFLGWAVLIFYLNFPHKLMQLWFCIVLILVLGTGVWTIKWDPEKRRWSMLLPLRWQATLILITALAALGATLLDWAQGTGPIFRHLLWVPFVLLFYWKGVLWAGDSLFLRNSRGAR